MSFIVVMEDGFVEKPWGSYKVLARGDNYLVKELTITPNSAISLQYHRFRSESWTIVSGKGFAVCGPKKTELVPGFVFYVPKGAVHRIRNIQNEEDLVFIEVQLGRNLSEEDITRLQDDYGRVDELISGMNT